MSAGRRVKFLAQTAESFQELICVSQLVKCTASESLWFGLLAEVSCNREHSAVGSMRGVIGVLMCKEA